jgi:anti-anti-sigma factor
MSDNKVIEMKPSKSGLPKGRARALITFKESLTHQSCERLQAKFQECLEQYKNEIILDCKSIAFMDSEGLELLIKMNDELRIQGGALKIVCLNDVCRDILLATRLINTLNIYKDIQDAMKVIQ